MPFQPVNATALVELVYTLDSQIIENTLYFRRDNEFSIGDLIDVGIAMRDWWGDNMAPILSNRLSLVRVLCTSLQDQTGPAIAVTTGLPIAGEVNSDPVPNNCALCVTLRTALIGRSFRGRNYVPAIPEANVVLNTVEDVVANAIVAAYQNIPAAAPAGTTHVVVSRTVNGVVQMPSALTNEVVGYTIFDKVIDSQRRRLPGRGR